MNEQKSEKVANTEEEYLFSLINAGNFVQLSRLSPLKE